jgi:nucleotide-binding universal stress UspA family protein
VLNEEECQRWGVDHVIMGAYGRARITQMLGSVTRRVMADSPVPMILGN